MSQTVIDKNTLLREKNAAIGSEKHVMALDALSKLTSLFSRVQKFDEVANTLLWTISGQLSVPSIFIVLNRRSDHGNKMSWFTSGKFSRNQGLKNIGLNDKHLEYFSNHYGPQQIQDLLANDSVSDLAMDLSDYETKVLCPLLHNDDFFGLIGLGARVGQSAYRKDDLEILGTLAATITPFIVNSYLFQEIANFGRWHAEIINNVRQGMVVFGSDMRLKSANRAATEMLRQHNGYSEWMKSLVGLTIDLVFPPRQFAGWSTAIKTAIESGKTGFVDNMVIHSEEGDCYFSLWLARTEERSGSGMDSILTIEDVTDQKNADERLFELHRLADKGQMAASIAHELNNLLAMVLGGIQLASSALDRGDNENLRLNLSRVDSTVQNLKRFTRGLTDFGRLGTAKGLVNPKDIVTEILSFVKVQRRFAHTRIVEQYDKEVPHAQLDRDQITQLLLNFLHNASDAILESNRGDGTITVSLRSKPGWICLEVADNGIGMPDEVRENLFKERQTTKPGGHGFGLITCAKIVDVHGGKISVSSEPGKGATFMVELPVS